MSWEKFNKTIYFFSDFNENIDVHLAKKMSNILYVEFVNYRNFYDMKNVTNKFNKSVDLIPHHIKSIIFNEYFNMPITELPIKLKELIFGNKFNKNVSNLPPNLVKLIFGNEFNQEIDNLPPIKILYLGHYFNKSLDYLPSSIIYLALNMNLLIKSQNLPSNIEHIVIIDANHHLEYELKMVENNIPKKCKVIKKHFNLPNKKIRL